MVCEAALNPVWVCTV